MDNLEGKLTEYKSLYIKVQQKIMYKCIDDYIGAKTYSQVLVGNNLELQLLESQIENIKMKINFEKEIKELRNKLNKLEKVCSICYDVPCTDDNCFNTIYKTTCGHIFHRYCLEIWLKNYKNSSCPICRGPIIY
jgi:hypothetical protein